MNTFICNSCHKPDKECDCISTICPDCKKEFKITREEVEWFKMKGYALPKRCKPCRIIRRQNNKSVIEKK